MRWPFSARVVAPSDGPAAERLQALLSSDPSRIRAAARDIAHLRDATELDVLAAWIGRIDRAIAGIALGRTLLADDVHVTFAMRRLRYWQEHAGCTCGLYPHYLFFDPRREAQHGHVRIKALGEAEGGWGQMHTVICSECGSGWQASDREYHYPWWEWQRVPEFDELGPDPVPGEKGT